MYIFISFPPFCLLNFICCYLLCCRIAEARLPGNNFVVEKKTSWADGETQIVTVTDISASAVRSDDSITVWYLYIFPHFPTISGIL